MVDIIKTPLRYFVSVDSTGAPNNYQREYQQRVEDNGVELFPAQVKVEDITATEYQAFFDNASIALSATVAQLNAANVALQSQIDGFKAERDAALADAASANAESTALQGQLDITLAEVADLKAKAKAAIAAAQPLVQATGG